MEKNIKVRIKDRVAVAEGDPEIICGNSDYTVTFSFDEEWGQAFAKTARFNFNTAEGPGHIDQPFTGDTVEVPELSNIREVEVGVFVGDLNTTTGAPIRCKPCIRCGSGAPHDPAPDVYDALMELINKGGGGAGEGGTLNGLPVYVVNSLPEKPKKGDVVALNSTYTVPWDCVKVWGRDETGYIEADKAHVFANFPSEGNLSVKAPSSLFNFDEMWDRSKRFAGGIAIVGVEGACNLFVQHMTENSPCLVGYQTDEEVYFYFEKGYVYEGAHGTFTSPDDGWYIQDVDEMTCHPIPFQSLPSFELTNVRILDLSASLPDEEVEEMLGGGIDNSWPNAFKILHTMASISRNKGIYVAEETGDALRWQILVSADGTTTFVPDEETEKRLRNLENNVMSNTTFVNNIQNNLIPNIWDYLLGEQKDRIDLALNTATATAATVQEMKATVKEITENAIPKIETFGAKTTELEKETNTQGERIKSLENKMEGLENNLSGYADFLDEINGEVV